MSSLHAPEIEYKPPPDAKKRGAIIGSAAKLNPEGVLAAVREAKAKEKEQQRLVRHMFIFPGRFFSRFGFVTVIKVGLNYTMQDWRQL